VFGYEGHGEAAVVDVVGEFVLELSDMVFFEIEGLTGSVMFVRLQFEPFFVSSSEYIVAIE
jgi:hypothetical protein